MPRAELHQLLTLPLGLCQVGIATSTFLSFLQAQFSKQFLQQLAFRKDEQGASFSCTAVILPAPCVEAQGVVVIAEGILGCKAGTHKANQGWGACRGKCLAEKPALRGDCGSTLRLPQTRRFGHKMEL